MKMTEEVRQFDLEVVFLIGCPTHVLQREDAFPNHDCIFGLDQALVSSKCFAIHHDLLSFLVVCNEEETTRSSHPVEASMNACNAVVFHAVFFALVDAQHKIDASISQRLAPFANAPSEMREFRQCTQ